MYLIMKDYIDTADILQYTRQYNFRNLFEDGKKIDRSLTTTPTKYHMKQRLQTRLDYSPNNRENCIEINAIPLQHKLVEYNRTTTKLNKIKQTAKVRSSLAAPAHKQRLSETKNNLKLIQKVTLLQLIKDISPNTLKKQELKRIHIKICNQKQLALLSQNKEKDKTAPIQFNHDNLYIGNKNVVNTSSVTGNKGQERRRKKKIIELVNKERKVRKLANIKENAPSVQAIEGFGIRSIFPYLKESSTLSNNSLKRKSAMDIIEKRNQSKSFITKNQKQPVLSELLEIEKIRESDTSTIGKNLIEVIKAKRDKLLSLSKSKSIDANTELKKADFISVVICPKPKN
jgi:hypothetical protein